MIQSSKMNSVKTEINLFEQLFVLLRESNNLRGVMRVMLNIVAHQTLRLLQDGQNTTGSASYLGLQGRRGMCVQCEWEGPNVPIFRPLNFMYSRDSWADWLTGNFPASVGNKIGSLYNCTSR